MTSDCSDAYLVHNHSNVRILVGTQYAANFYYELVNHCAD